MCPTVHEYRCTSCGKLFFKGLLVEGEIEIKCRTCHTLNHLHVSNASELVCLIEHCPNRVTLKK